MEDIGEVTVLFGSNGRIVGEMVAGRTVEQKFLAMGPCLESVRLKVGTYKRKNIGNMLEVSIIDDAGDMVASKTVNPRLFSDFMHNEVRIGCPVEMMKQYTLLIRSDSGVPGRCVTFVCGGGRGSDPFFVDGKQVPGMELFCNIVFSNHKFTEEIERPPTSLSYADDVPSSDVVVPIRKKRKRKDDSDDNQQV